jgi:hypothetical protein
LDSNDREATMLSRRLLAVTGVLALVPQVSLGAEFVDGCMDLQAVRAAIASHDGKLIDLTPDQWQFLRGIYAVNPYTSPSLPYGDKAMLAEVNGESDALVFFIDGDKACTPIQVPHEFLSLMDQVAVRRITHYGAGI